MKSFFCRFCLLITLLLCLTGCIQFEYTGREYAPRTDGKEPLFFTNRQKIPAGMYIIAGRATVTVPGGTDSDDVKNRLLDEAADRGMDAVCIVSQKKITEGLFRSDAQFSGPESYRNNPFNLTPDGAKIQVNMAGETVNPVRKTPGTLKTIFQVLFLKNKSDAEKINTERKKQLDEIIRRTEGKN